MAAPRATADGIAALVRDRVPEGRHYEYKAALPSSNDRDVKEFLADVSSFANSSGGLLIFGIREEGGTPVEVVGLGLSDLDAEVARLESFVRDGVEPRIPGIEMFPIQLDSKAVLAISIARSWALPHAVTARGHWRFYGRNSSGKYPLDVSELRGAFDRSASARDRISSFRTNRLAAVAAGDTPIAVEPTACTILHLVPFNSLDPGFAIDLAKSESLPLLYASSWSYRYSLEGFLTYSHLRDPAIASSYTLLMRDGTIEAFDTDLLRSWEGKTFVPSGAYEHKIVAALPEYLERLSSLGVTPPVVIMLSLLGVQGYFMGVDDFRFRRWGGTLLKQNELLLPGVTIDDFDQPAPQILRPIFDTLWNSFGYERSYNYDEQGNWTGTGT